MFPLKMTPKVLGSKQLLGLRLASHIFQPFSSVIFVPPSRSVTQELAKDSLQRPLEQVHLEASEVSLCVSVSLCVLQ